jgi:hypothetical protein
MESRERNDWSVYKQIFSDHWEGFKKKYPVFDTKYHDDLVEKMLKCGDPKQMGYLKYGCLSCGLDSRVISMSCKSFLCLRCGKVYVDNWVSQLSKMLHEGVIYRHIVLTTPDIFRTLFFENPDLLDPLFKCGVECLDEYFSRVSRKELKGGYIVVLQTHGRSGSYNVHLHIIATSGGLDQNSGKWVHLGGYLPFTLIHHLWQKYLLNMLLNEVDTEEIERLKKYCEKEYPEGFVANIQEGDVPMRYESLAKYLAKYVVTPPISVRRIDCYDGKRVSYHYRSHKTNKIEYDTVSVYRFIGRMVQHILPMGFKRIRYYGVQATKTFEKIKDVVKEALSKVKKVVKCAVKIIDKKYFRERYKESTGRDPLICRNCGKELELWSIWIPKYGFIYDIFKFDDGEKDERERETEISGRTENTSIRSSPQGIQISLFNMWEGVAC